MIRIMPAIDIIEGKCVRLTKGDYATKKEYNVDPLDIALQYQDVGVQQIHIVDLDGAKAKHPQNLSVIERIRTKTDVSIEFGGGIKTDQALYDCQNAGVNQMIIGSLAVQNQEQVIEWLRRFGQENFIIGADVLEGKIAIHGWQEKSALSIEEFVTPYAEHGLEHVLCTDISKDGMLSGTSQDLYSELVEKYPDQKWIASGGVHTMKEIDDLQDIGMDAVVVGKAIFEGHISLSDIASFILQNT